MKIIEIWNNNFNYDNPQNETNYNNHKMYMILFNVYQSMVNLGYGINFDVKYKTELLIDNNDKLMDLIKSIYQKLKRVKLNKIYLMGFGIYDNDDYYCLCLMDDNNKIIKKIFWDFDFEFFKLNDYDIKFNLLEW